MENQNIDQQVEQLDNILKNRKFPIKYNDDFVQICNMRYDELSALSAEDCGMYAFILGQYSLYIQTQLNTETARAKWFKHKLNAIVAKCGQDYDKYLKFEERSSLVIRDNQAAFKLHFELLKSELIMEELSFLSSKISTLSQILLDLVNTKRRKEYVPKTG